MDDYIKTNNKNVEDAEYYKDLFKKRKCIWQKNVTFFMGNIPTDILY